MDDDHRTPWQADRDEAERTGRWPESWGPFHRHFANDAVHRDGGPECDQPGTPRRVYVFDPDYLHEHELIVARYAIAHPEQFAPEPGDGEAAAGAGTDYMALTGKFYVNITRRDGTEDVGYPAIAADGTWRYHVPAGIRLVGMTSVSAGDMVSGKLDLTEW